ncbi:hypothetical protein [Xanthobacter agilis]|uniref:hypothetical protein n=1 Tax=Xanthobacter agilis TaxID=47492 RepID=UPI00372809CC
MIREAKLRAHPLATLLPRNLLVRAVAIAALCAAIGSKAIITAAFSLIIVPLVAYATIADMPATKDARASR